jgi:hypothetical protein
MLLIFADVILIRHFYALVLCLLILADLDVHEGLSERTRKILRQVAEDEGAESSYARLCCDYNVQLSLSLVAQARLWRWGKA